MYHIDNEKGLFGLDQCVVVLYVGNETVRSSVVCRLLTVSCYLQPFRPEVIAWDNLKSLVAQFESPAYERALQESHNTGGLLVVPLTSA